MKALACDFDGTFYFMGENEPIKQCDIDAVKEFQAQGHLFGFCTGRPLIGLTDYLDKNVKADFYILNSGATIFDKNQNLIFEKTIPKEITDTLMTYGVEHNYSVDFHMDGKFWCVREGKTRVCFFEHWIIVHRITDAGKQINV